MGSQCTKARTPPQRNLKPSPQLKFEESIKSPLKQNTYLRVVKPSSTNSGQENKQQFTKIFDEKTKYIKFTEETGILDIDSSLGKIRSSSNVIQHQFGEFRFHVQRSQLGNYIVELIDRDIKFWRKIKTQEPLEIREKDELLFGNLLIKVRYWLNKEETQHFKKQADVKLNPCKDQNAECRFCLQGNLDPENILLQPCNCTGSTKAIHQKCLSRWIFGTPAPYSEDMRLYRVVISNYHCQICKKCFSAYIWSRIMNIIATFQGEYAILELGSAETTKKQNPTFLILKYSATTKSIQIPSSFYKNVATAPKNLNIRISKDELNGLVLEKKMENYENEIKNDFYIGNDSPYIQMKQEYLIDGFEVCLTKN